MLNYKNLNLDIVFNENCIILINRSILPIIGKIDENTIIKAEESTFEIPRNINDPTEAFIEMRRLEDYLLRQAN